MAVAQMAGLPAAMHLAKQFLKPGSPAPLAHTMLCCPAAGDACRPTVEIHWVVYLSDTALLI